MFPHTANIKGGRGKYKGMKKILLMSLATLAIAAPTVSTVSAQHCTVRKGDSMHRIAERYNIEFAKILELNKHFKDANLIHPNDRVEMPDNNGHESTTTQSKANNNNLTAAERETSNTQAQAVLNIVNSERAKQGLKALALDDTLNTVAAVKSKDMSVNHYFSHTSPSYGSPFDLMHAFGVDYKSAGENIAQGQKDAETVMNDWLHSSGHRANILNKDYTHIGIGFYSDGNYWTQEFIQK